MAGVVPEHGFTRGGVAVHGRVLDFHDVSSGYQRFNRFVAVRLTLYVGSMTCFWVFCGLALCSLPAVLSQFGVFAHVFPAAIIKVSVIGLVAWVAQTLIQLVLLPALMVGQNLQNVAADVRAAKTFEDVEVVLDRLDLKTEGGLKAVLDAVEAVGGVAGS